MNKRRIAGCWLALLPCAALLLGCGDGRPTRVPVAGRVLIDGKPVERGFIRVIPADARAAHGEIGSDGSFRLTTYQQGDGVVPGTHPVTVIASQGLNNGTATKFFVPLKYHSPATSETTVTIDEPTDSLLIELTWEGSGQAGPYTVETFSSGDADPAAVVD